MPFRSKAQMRWMFATHPRMAKRWAEETPNTEKLPEKVDKKKKNDLGITLVRIAIQRWIPKRKSTKRTNKS